MRKKKHSYPPGQHIPAWIDRELERINPRLYLIYVPDIRAWEVWQDIDYYSMTERGDRRHQVVSLCKGVFQRLDQAFIGDLDRRRQIGLKLKRDNGSRNPAHDPYWQQQVREHREAKEKERELGLDEMTSGVMTMHRILTSKTFA